jgi:hypothetical protein
MTRRQFVGGALAAAGVVTGAPAFLRGQNLNGKLDIAFIASGGRAPTSCASSPSRQSAVAAAPRRRARWRRIRRERMRLPPTWR